MKKTLTLICCLAAVTVLAQDNHSWRFGIQTGIAGNPSKYKSGMTNAPSQFTHNSYTTGAFDLLLRYDRNPRWGFLTGIGFSSAGFNFALARDYSLTDECNSHYTMLDRSVPVVAVPVLALLKTNLNCRNWRWVFGAGIVNSFSGAVHSTQKLQLSQQEEVNPESIEATLSSDGGYHFQTRFLVSREKQFRRGALLNLTLFCNFGTDEVAEASVSYNVKHDYYHHTFTNNGGYCGFGIAYLFGPFGSRKLAPKPSDVLPLKDL